MLISYEERQITRMFPKSTIAVMLKFHLVKLHLKRVLLQEIMKIIPYVKSLFTDKPILISKYQAWYYVRGKRKSAKQLVAENAKEYSDAIINLIENGPNIKLEL